MLNFFLIQRQPPQQFSVSCHTAGAWLVWYWKRKCHLQNNQFCFFIGGKRVSTPCPASCGEESHLTVYSSCQTHQALFPTRRKKPVDCSVCCLQESLHWPQLQRNSEFFFFFTQSFIDGRSLKVSDHEGQFWKDVLGEGVRYQDYSNPLYYQILPC